jgi:hypothetical protein
MSAEGCWSVPAKIGRPPERFCKRGHDTWELGRVPKNGWCRGCARMAESMGGSITGGRVSKAPKRPLRWQRARVAKWLEIAAADPLEPTTNTHARLAQFERRYARLEAEIPTP